MNLRSSAAVAALSLSFGLIVPPPPAPVSAAHPGEPPTVTADAWILYDATSDVVLAGTGIDEERAMASVTKIMTALVARQHLDLDAEVRISDTAAAAGESEVGLVAGERWTVRDLFYALLVRSGNDAAIALAEATAGSVERLRRVDEPEGGRARPGPLELRQCPRARRPRPLHLGVRPGGDGPGVAR